MFISLRFWYQGLRIASCSVNRICIMDQPWKMDFSTLLEFEFLGTLSMEEIRGSQRLIL